MKPVFIFIVVFTVWAWNSVQAQVYKAIHLETPGTLSSLLTPGERINVTYLAITGNINSDDLNTMRNMMLFREAPASFI
jgi:hypothetical protein